MNTEPSRFQDGFVQALLTPHDAPPEQLRALVAQPGFCVCRNTFLKGCIDTLQANYPPGNARLPLYRIDFPDFLRDFAPAARWA